MRFLPNRLPGSPSPQAAHRIFCAALLIAACALVAAPAGAASTAFSGELVLVLEDTGGGLYTGASDGDRFGGSLTFGDTEDEAFETTLEPTEAGWEFLGQQVLLTDGTNPVTGSESFVTIQDNFVLDAEGAAFVTLLLGVSVAPGTQADTWNVSGLSSGAFEEDTDPFDGDDTEELFNGFLWEVSYFSLDTNTIVGLDYQPFPPPLPPPGDTTSIAIYSITQADVEGNVLFAAIGVLDSTVIPIPAAAWLFGSALGLLGLARRRFS